MSEIMGILGVAGLFLLRVGLPVMLLVAVGILIDRWQSRREAEVWREYQGEQEAVAEEDAKAAQKRDIA